jgi:DNA-binding SARP family transcriptional activator
MEFGVLGPLEVRDPDRGLLLFTAGQRSALAMLLLIPQVVPASRLIEAVWDEVPPQRAQLALQMLVSRLRRVLQPRDGRRPAQPILLTRPGGYLLQVTPGALDLHRFQELVAAGRQALAAGTADRAAWQLQQALGLWRGSALADVPSQWLQRVQVPRLDEQRLAALEDRIEADLRLGRHGPLVAELEALVAAEPLRERLSGQQMVALYRSGRQAEALGVYRRLRRVLREELGLDPGPQLQRLERAILSRDPSLDPPSTAAGGGRPATTAAATRRRAVPVPAQLPPDTSDFTGRAMELARLRERLGSATGVGAAAAVVISAIDGKAGIGKSALAVHLAHELAPRFPDGVLYVNLRGAEPQRLVPLEVLAQFLRALGLDSERIPADLDEATGAYRSLLAGRRILVVLDNAADAAQVRPLLPAAVGCGALVTSRAPLADLDGATPLRLDLLPEADAIGLLARMVEQDRVAAEPDAAVTIVRACGRLPLAVRIIGARLRARPAWPLQAMALRLADERRRLDELAVGELAVRSSLHLSYQGLTPVEARMFRLLALPDGPDATSGVAAALLGCSLSAAETSLERLVDMQLLETPAPGRYRFHDLLRLFARERARAEEDEQALQAALGQALAWYATTAERADQLIKPAGLRRNDDEDGRRFVDRRSALAWLEAERVNLVAAARQAAATHASALAPAAWRFHDALWRFFDLRTHWADWHTVSQVTVQAAERTGNRAAMARALNSLGIIHGQQRHYAEATGYFVQGLTVAREIGDRRIEGRLLNNLGLVYLYQGRHRAATDMFEKSLSLHREIDDRLSEGVALNNLGETHRRQGRYPEAIVCYEQDLMICREVGDTRGAAFTLQGLAEACRDQGRYQEAARYAEDSLVICREVGDRFEEAKALWRLGCAVAPVQGQPAARVHWVESLGIFESLGAPEADEVRQLLTNANGSR